MQRHQIALAHGSKAAFFELILNDLPKSLKAINLIHKHHQEENQNNAYAFAISMSADHASHYDHYDKTNLLNYCQRNILNSIPQTLTATFFKNSELITDAAYKELVEADKLTKNTLEDLTTEDLQHLISFKHWKVNCVLFICYCQNIK